jgi:hypothetical protein
VKRSLLPSHDAPAYDGGCFIVLGLVVWLGRCRSLVCDPQEAGSAEKFKDLRQMLKHNAAAAVLIVGMCLSNKGNRR